MKTKHATLIGLLLAFGAQNLNASAVLPDESGVQDLPPTSSEIMDHSSGSISSSVTIAASASTAAIDCEEQADKVLPLSLILTRMLKASRKDVDFKISKDGKNLEIGLPKIVTACLDLKATDLKYVDGKLVVAFVNEKKYDAPTGSMMTKYDECLKNEPKEGDPKFLSKDGKKLDFGLAHKKGMYRSLGFSLPLPAGVDKTKALELVYASPKDSGYPNAYGAPVRTGCYAYEPLKDKSLMLITEQEARLNKAKKDLEECVACEGKDKLAEEIDKIRTGALGNTASVEEIVKKVHDQLTNKKAEELKKKLAELETSIRTGKDREIVKGEMDEYLKVMRELKKIDFDRKVGMVEELVKKLPTANKEEKQVLQRQIKELNGEIAKYTKIIPEALVKNLEKLALTGQAEETFKLRLSAKKYVESAGKKDRKAVEREIEREMDAYNYHLEIVEKRYEAKEGYAEHSAEYERKARELAVDKKESWEEAMGEYKEGMEACSQHWFSVKNPVRCDRWKRRYQDWQRGTNEMLMSYDEDINRHQALYMEFRGLEYEAQRRQAKELGFGNDRRYPRDTYLYNYADRYSTDQNYNFSGGRYPAMGPQQDPMWGQPWGQQQPQFSGPQMPPMGQPNYFQQTNPFTPAQQFYPPR